MSRFFVARARVGRERRGARGLLGRGEEARLPDRQHGLPLAEGARAAPKVRVLVLVEHRAHAARRDDEAGVDQAVQQLGRRLDRLLLLLREAGGRGALDVENCVQRELVVRHLRAQARQVEVVLDEVLLDLGEKLVALERAKPGDPAHTAEREAVRPAVVGGASPACGTAVGARRHQDVSSASLGDRSDSDSGSLSPPAAPGCDPSGSRPSASHAAFAFGADMRASSYHARRRRQRRRREPPVTTSPAAWVVLLIRAEGSSPASHCQARPQKRLTDASHKEISNRSRVSID